jgi:RNAse (barnase) inhibitor barstar
LEQNAASSAIAVEQFWQFMDYDSLRALEYGRRDYKCSKSTGFPTYIGVALYILWLAVTDSALLPLRVAIKHIGCAAFEVGQLTYGISSEEEIRSGK